MTKVNTAVCFWAGCKRRHERTVCGLSEQGASSTASEIAMNDRLLVSLLSTFLLAPSANRCYVKQYFDLCVIFFHRALK